MSRFQGGPRRLLLSADVKGYGQEDERSQFDIQRALVRILDEAAEAVGFDRTAWIRQGAGDGELAILPDGVSEAKVVDDYVAELQAVLERHNHRVRTEHWLRLRLAVHFGTAHPADNGYAGHGVVLVSRLVDSDPLRQALIAAPESCLAVILSEQVYTDTVLQRLTKLSPKEFRQVAVEKKERQVTAWLRVPGANTHALDLGATASVPVAPVPESAARPAPAGIVLNGPVHAPGSVFGVGTVNNHGVPR